MALAIGLGFGLLALPAAAQDAPPDHAGRAVYNKTCAMCHDNPGATRAATLASVKLLSPARLREVISEGGVMAPMAAISPATLPMTPSSSSMAWRS